MKLVQVDHEKATLTIAVVDNAQRPLRRDHLHHLEPRHGKTDTVPTKEAVLANPRSLAALEAALFGTPEPPSTETVATPEAAAQRPPTPKKGKG